MRTIELVFLRVRAIGLVLLGACVTSIAVAGGNMDSINKFAWTEDAGWLNFGPADSGGVTVANRGSTNYLSGYAWAENVGWISLGASNATPPYANTSASDYGVNMDGAGKLSGYAWSETAGWINFSNSHSQVGFDTNSGCFSGYAWAENLGWINFSNASPVAYCLSTTWLPDLTPPTASIAISPVLFVANQSGVATVTVSEAVTGFDTSDIQVTGGTNDGFSMIDALHYQVMLTAGVSDGPLVVTIVSNAFMDLAENTLVSQVETSATVDVTSPTASITIPTVSFLTNQSGVATVTVSEAGSGFDTDDVQVSGGTKDGFSQVDALHYQVMVTAGASEGMLVVSIASNAFTDLAGNPLASQVEASATVDATPPTASIAISPALFMANQSGVATVTVSEVVSGFDASDIQVTGGTKGSFATVDATHYVVAVTAGAGEGLMVVAIASNAFTDLAGNPLVAQVEASATVDATPPTASLTISPTLFMANQSGVATVTVSEAVSGFESSDIQVTGGAKGVLTAVDTTHYVVAVTAGNGVVPMLTLTIGAGALTDLAGNPLMAQAQATATINRSGSIDSSNSFVWVENAGWINFVPLDGGVTVLVPSGVSGCLNGQAWAENIGWISLAASNAALPYANTSASDYGINVDAGGNLSGYAWSENAGWISFSNNNGNVRIDFNTGDFDGYAWGENIGWIHFKDAGVPPQYQMKTMMFGRSGSVFLFR